MANNTAPLPMVITPSVLVERARAIATKWARRAEEIDSASKLPDDLIAEWTEAGLIATLVPKRHGGYELGLDTASEIIRIFAGICPSAAWVLAFYIGHNWIHCQFPEEAQQEIFANGPSPRSAGVLAPLFKLRPVEGGYRITGRNSWNSGSPHADWIMSSGMVQGTDPATPVTFIMPRSDAALVDTWNMEGMRATGSWDVILDDVFIPAHRTLPSGGLFTGQNPGSAVHANPFYTRPLILLTFAYCLPVFVGAARGATDEFVGKLKTRVGTNDGKSASSRQAMQMLAGRGEARVQMAETMLEELVASIMNSADTAARFDVPGRLALKARGAMLVEFCKETIGDVVLGAGANAFRKDSKLQMIYRDISMISVHAFFEQGSATEALGRCLLGMEQTGPV